MAKDPIDIYVGQRVQHRRKFVGMSQDQLGKKLGVTFQQVQKYETGVNRLGASKLFLAAKILQVDVGYFFEGLSEQDNNNFSTDIFVDDTETAKLVKAFNGLENKTIRKNIVKLVQAIHQDAIKNKPS